MYARLFQNFHLRDPYLAYESATFFPSKARLSFFSYECATNSVHSTSKILKSR